MDEINELAIPEPRPDPLAHLTPQQRMVYHVCYSIGRDMDRGTVAEQHTAALLRLMGEVVKDGREAEVVALVRGWALERERGES